MLHKIEIQELQENLDEYLKLKSPVAVTHKGHTIGYFVPTPVEIDSEDIKSFKVAATKLDKMLAEKGITEDELVAEFQQLRQDQE
ncbi:MAG: type II toxin-antitoxin system Phd/YefM family antitoxin [Crocosphaera sp.]|nr:type II toxin-antitoxin system Phd/YefM family antitoxin [Crocosphaera sp.]